MGVTPAASVDAFFYEVLTDALEDRGLETLESTECYLVGLLGEFTRARITDEPLSLKLAGAGEDGDAGQRVRTLKEVGDTTLYVSGFFAESLERQLVAVEYYIGLGEVAYSELARRVETSSLAEVYRELSANFPRFVDVLATVREKIHFAGPDVVKLYQQWLRSRSEWIERRLRALGLILPGPDGGGDGYLQ
jgi:hypothetical protein